MVGWLGAGQGMKDASPSPMYPLSVVCYNELYDRSPRSPLIYDRSPRSPLIYDRSPRSPLIYACSSVTPEARAPGMHSAHHVPQGSFLSCVGCQ